MPLKSQDQRRWAYATAEGKTDADPSVGREFINSSRGVTGLPKKVGSKKHPSQQSTTPGVGKLFNRHGNKFGSNK